MATGGAGVPRVKTGEARSALPGPHSPHWWRAHAEGDGIGHDARA